MSFALASCGTWAERDFKSDYPGCSEPLQIAAVGEGWFSITQGCGNRQYRMLSTNGEPEGGGQAITEVVERFNFETKCPQEELSFKRLQEDSFGISGCGHSAVYKLLPYAGWVTDSVTSPAK